MLGKAAMKNAPVYATILGSVAVAGALGWLSASAQSREIERAQVARLQAAADARTRAVVAATREDLSALNFLAGDESFMNDCRRALAGDASARSRAARTIAVLMNHRGFLSVRLVASGKIVLSVPRQPKPVPGAWSLEVPAPAFGPHASLRAQTPVAALAGEYPAPKKTSDGLYTSLLRRDGDEIAFWNDRLETPPRRHVSMLTPGLVGARALRGERGLLSGVDYRGAPVLAFAESVPDSNWVVTAKLDSGGALGPVRRREALFVFGFSALGLLSGLVLVRLLRGEAARARHGLSRRRALLLRAVEQLSEAVIITDAAGRIEYVNPAFTRATGYERAEVLGGNPSFLKSGRQSRGFYEELWATLTRGDVWRGQFVNKRKDGTLFQEEAAIAPVRRGGRTVHYIAVKRDVSRERRLADQFLQAQKMEPLGLLAGGVAHDINNLLTAIAGYGEFIASAHPESQTSQDAREILRACARAADLTRQLLSFGRKGPGKAELLDLNAAVAAVQKLLRRVLNANIALRLDTSATPVWALIDPTALDQALLNLAVNARDAMPDGGTLTIRVDVADGTIDSTQSEGGGVPGLYARLSVVDTGSGMSPEVKARLFEPFFTTKPAGHGTGLGLAIVRTVADGAGGHIGVDSAPGRGTTFRLYLPLAAAPSPTRSAQAGSAAPLRGAGETVLIVEYDDDLRRMIERVLKAQGYTALACHDAEEACAVEAAHRAEIHAVLCDIALPGMDGRAFAAQLRRSRPTVRTVLISGHASGTDNADAGLLVKPFTMVELCRRVHEAVGRAD